MNYSITRTIQSVGQGGFYTEIFDIPNHEGGMTHRCVVYDCGSASRSEPKRTIESALYDEPGLDIDILFISHFDNDHVNGIVELSKRHKIKHIVIPQIEDYEWYYVLEDSIKRENFQPRARLVRDFLGMIKGSASLQEIPIIQIAPIYESGEHVEIINEERPSININKILPSGSVLSPFEKELGWIYIPVNTMERTKIELLKVLLKPIFTDVISSFSNFESLSGEQCAKVIAKKRREINKVYSKVFGNSNASSMCLYSGLDSQNNQSVIDCQANRYYCCCPLDLCMRKENFEACLYTGDSNLKDPKLGLYLSRLLMQYKSRIGLIQIPHHGSVHNSTEASFNAISADDKSRPVLFVSYGCYNRYGHPSTRLIGKLRANNYMVMEVTEKKDSYYMEYIQVY